MDEKQDKKPCCAADALRQVQRIDVGGVAIGFVMLDAVFAEVAAMEIWNTAALGEELVRRVREHNYIPPGAEAMYAAALIEEFRADERDRHSGGCGCLGW